jgi:FO synthase
MTATRLDELLRAAADGVVPDADTALAELVAAPLDALHGCAETLTLSGFGPRVSYSRKVFIPLTQLCRNVCHYCTFAHRPRHLPKPYLDLDDVLAVARAGAAAG